jgi:tripartite-type tricarboxylate transporter receptor subunit TctC
MIASPPPVIDFIRAGRLRALGITSAKRSALMPDVPTIAEAGVPSYDSGVWYTLLAPAKTPKTVVDRVNGAVLKTVHSPKIRPQLEAQGAEPAGSTPEEAAAFIRAESEKNAQLVKQAGLKVE